MFLGIYVDGGNQRKRVCLLWALFVCSSCSSAVCHRWLDMFVGYFWTIYYYWGLDQTERCLLYYCVHSFICLSSIFVSRYNIDDDSIIGISWYLCWTGGGGLNKAGLLRVFLCSPAVVDGGCRRLLRCQCFVCLDFTPDLMVKVLSYVYTCVL